MLNLANILTLSRLVILPIIIGLIYLSGFWPVMVAFGLYVIGSLTDFLDGWVARKYDQITPFGIFLDPISDKVYVGGILIVLIASHSIMGWWVMLPILILSRELLISGLREFLGPHDVQFPVTKLAKWKTASQMIALGLLIPSPYWPTGEIGLVFLTIATFLTLQTGWEYLKTGLEHIRKMS